jgi:hypothetical protein
MMQQQEYDMMRSRQGNGGMVPEGSVGVCPLAVAVTPKPACTPAPLQAGACTGKYFRLNVAYGN